MDPTRELHFCSDFPNLVKCVHNSFVDNGFNTPDGCACIEHIEGAWEKDKEALTLKAMPHLTKCHVRPSSFEKMKVNFAFTLLSEEALKGMCLYKAHLQQSPSSITRTVELIIRMSRLIAIMTSRLPSEALRRSSQRAAGLEAFLVFLDEWEDAEKKKERWLYQQNHC